MDRSYPVYPLGLDVVMNRFFELQGKHRLPEVNLCFGTSSYDSSKFIDRERLASNISQSSVMRTYGNAMGEIELRTEIAAILSEAYRIDLSPGRVFVTDGASGALAATLIALFQPGDEVIIPSIFFPPYPLLVHMVGATTKFTDLDSDMNPTVESVRAAMTPKTMGLLLNSPGNPFGNIISRERLESFIELGIPIISDEVYGFLGTKRAPSILELSQDHFVIGSFSKTYAAAGLRIGYVVVPEKYVQTIFAVRVGLNVCASLPSQVIARELLASHAKIVPEHVAFIEQARELFLDLCALHRLKLVTQPTGGLFGVVDLQELSPKSSLDTALELVERFSLGTAPGVDFAQQDPRFLRINYSAPSLSVETGLARLRAFAESRA